jgi:hypothetical protein
MKFPYGGWQTEEWVVMAVIILVFIAIMGLAWVLIRLISTFIN